MRSGRSGSLLLAGVLASGLVVAGCSSSPRPVRTSSATSSPVVSASASTSAPSTSPVTTRPTSSPRSSSHAAASTSPAGLPSVGGSPTVVLDPGHNGGNASHLSEIDQQVPAGFGQYKACNTTGTSTDAGYSEHAFNWDVALRVRAILQAKGVHVIMTRPNDTGWGPCVNVRAQIESEPGVKLAVAIHADGAPAAGHGFHVNLCAWTPVGATAVTMAGSKQLGLDLRNSLAASSGLTPSTYIGSDGMVYRTDLAGLNLSTVPTAFLELGNMRNSGDAALDSSAAGRQQIADAVAAGILAFLA